MENKSLKEQVREILNKISELQKELARLRKGCSHEEYKVDFIKERGISTLVRICRNCQKNIGYPTEEEKRQSGYL